MSTLVTPSGRRTDFGKRTACVLFVMNTDPRSTAHLSFGLPTTSHVYTFSIHSPGRQAMKAYLSSNAGDAPPSGLDLLDQGDALQPLERRVAGQEGRAAGAGGGEDARRPSAPPVPGTPPGMGLSCSSCCLGESIL
jgi:hypothetical protein